MSRYRYSAATVGRCASAHDVKPLDLSLRGRYVNEASPPDVHIVAMNSTDKENHTSSLPGYSTGTQVTVRIICALTSVDYQVLH